MNYMTKWYIISIAIVLQDPLICILWGSLNCFFLVAFKMKFGDWKRQRSEAA